MRYQTEVVIPADRYVCLQLPAFLPEGRAVVTVRVEAPASAQDPARLEPDPDQDREDIEWWEEFEGAEDR